MILYEAQVVNTTNQHKSEWFLSNDELEAKLKAKADYLLKFPNDNLENIVLT